MFFPYCKKKAMLTGVTITKCDVDDGGGLLLHRKIRNRKKHVSDL